MQIHAMTFALLLLKGMSAMKLSSENNVTMVIENESTTIDFSSRPLAITIGSIAATFSILLVLQWVIKRYICSKKENANQENLNEIESNLPVTHIYNGSILVTIPQTTTRPPSYENIHQYKQLDHITCTPIYYNVPGKKTFHGMLTKRLESKEGINDEDNEQPPPPYIPDKVIK